mgnify:CR=1 FL=1
MGAPAWTPVRRHAGIDLASTFALGLVERLVGDLEQFFPSEPRGHVRRDGHSADRAAQAVRQAGPSGGDGQRQRRREGLLQVWAEGPWQQEEELLAAPAGQPGMLWERALPMAGKSLKDFVAAAKSANPPFKVGGTGSRREGS